MTNIYLHFICAQVRAEHPGFVVGWRSGIAHQKGVCLGSCGLPDGLPMVVDYAEATGSRL